MILKASFGNRTKDGTSKDFMPYFGTDYGICSVIKPQVSCDWSNEASRMKMTFDWFRQCSTLPWRTLTTRPRISASMCTSSPGPRWVPRMVSPSSSTPRHSTTPSTSEPPRGSRSNWVLYCLQMHHHWFPISPGTPCWCYRWQCTTTWTSPSWRSRSWTWRPGPWCRWPSPPPSPAPARYPDPSHTSSCGID